MHVPETHIIAGAACAFVLGGGYLAFAVPPIWRGDAPLTSRLPWWPFGRTAWCAFSRSLPFEALHFVTIGIMLLTRVTLVIEIDVAVGWAVMLSIMVFNRPRLFVPPLYRHLPGLATKASWISRGYDHELETARRESTRGQCGIETLPEH
jgi:hypothetical protein